MKYSNEDLVKEAGTTLVKSWEDMFATKQQNKSPSFQLEKTCMI